MDNAVFSESLAYGQQKRRAVSARSFRVKIPSSNSTSFTAEQTIQVDLPGNLSGQYYNFNQMYLKLKVIPSANCSLDRAGALGFIKRLQISTAGAQICDINNYNVLATAMLDTDASCEYKAGYGNVLLGTLGDALKGVDLVAATPRVFCIPLVLNPLAMTQPHRLIPAFALSSLQVRLTLDSAASCVHVTAGAAPALAFSEVEMVCMMTELSPQAQAMVDASTGGKYNILASSFMNSGATRPASITALTANLGFSVSSLERIIAIHRPVASVDVSTCYSLGNRGTAGLSELQYLVNSESYPARPVVLSTYAAESLAETLIADHALVDFKKSSAFNNGFVPVALLGVGVSALSGDAPDVVKANCFAVNAPGGTTAGAHAAWNAAGSTGTASNIGTFVVATEFESGLSDGKSATIYSGISTIASVVQWVGKYSSATAAAFQIDFFAQFTALLSLDMRGSGVWSISI